MDQRQSIVLGKIGKLVVTWHMASSRVVGGSAKKEELKK